jgi:hypothetical protein
VGADEGTAASAKEGRGQQDKGLTSEEQGRQAMGEEAKLVSSMVNRKKEPRIRNMWSHRRTRGKQQPADES